MLVKNIQKISLIILFISLFMNIKLGNDINIKDFLFSLRNLYLIINIFFIILYLRNNRKIIIIILNIIFWYYYIKIRIFNSDITYISHNHHPITEYTYCITEYLNLNGLSKKFILLTPFILHLLTSIFLFKDFISNNSTGDNKK